MTAIGRPACELLSAVAHAPLGESVSDLMHSFFAKPSNSSCRVTAEHAFSVEAALQIKLDLVLRMPHGRDISGVANQEQQPGAPVHVFEVVVVLAPGGIPVVVSKIIVCESTTELNLSCEDAAQQRVIARGVLRSDCTQRTFAIGGCFDFNINWHTQVCNHCDAGKPMVS